MQIAPSSKNEISTYTTEKIPALGSCALFVVDPDTRYLKEVTFQVVNHEGSVIVSCATSLDLRLIQPYSKLNASIPDCGKLIFSSADHPNKYQNKMIESSSSVFKVPETEVNQYVTQEVQDENKQQQCPAQTDTMLQKRKCHKGKSANMTTEIQKLCNQVQERAQRGSNCYTTTQASNKSEKATSLGSFLLLLLLL